MVWKYENNRTDCLPAMVGGLSVFDAEVLGVLGRKYLRRVSLSFREWVDFVYAGKETVEEFFI